MGPAIPMLLMCRCLHANCGIGRRKRSSLEPRCQVSGVCVDESLDDALPSKRRASLPVDRFEVFCLVRVRRDFAIRLDVGEMRVGKAGIIYERNLTRLRHITHAALEHRVRHKRAI